MKKHIYPMVICSAVFLMTACGKDQQQPAQAQPQATPAVTTDLPTENLTTFTSYPTSIEGINSSEARPKIAGYITQVLVDEGQYVKRGQILFRLETQSLTQDADAAKANIRAAQVQVDQLKPLVEKNIVSNNQLATAQARLAQAQASYKSIVANMDYAVVRSPVNGFVGEIRQREGSLVSPSDPIPLTTVAEINKVYAYFSMNEKEYLDFLKNSEGATKEQKIKNMPKVTLVMANGDEYPYKGTVQTINSQVGKQSGTVTFRATFDNPEHTLSDGSTGEIQIPKQHEGVVVVPQKSTFERQGRTYVMKVQKNDTATVAIQTQIEIADTKDNLYIVSGGVNKGDEIVTDGVDKIPSGSAIQPQKKPFEEVSKPVETVFK